MHLAVYREPVHLLTFTFHHILFRMQVLDDLGDRSDPEVRQDYFNEIDTDGSGAIDFEEFLAVSWDQERPK